MAGGAAVALVAGWCDVVMARYVGCLWWGGQMFCVTFNTQLSAAILLRPVVILWGLFYIMSALPRSFVDLHSDD